MCPMEVGAEHAKTFNRTSGSRYVGKHATLIHTRTFQIRGLGFSEAYSLR